MTIYRDGKAIELTGDEIADAAKEFQINFYISEVPGDIPIDQAREIAETAYDMYCKGDGRTEYECLENALKKWSEGHTMYTYEIWEDGCCIHEDHEYSNDTYEDAKADAEEYICDMIDSGYDAEPEDLEIKIFFDGKEV